MDGEFHEPDSQGSAKRVHVGISAYDMEPNPICGVCVGLIAGVEDRSTPEGFCVGGLDKEVGSLAELIVGRVARFMADFACSSEDLANDEHGQDGILNCFC